MSTTYRELRRAVDAVVVAEDTVAFSRQKLCDAEAAMGNALRACRERNGMSLRQCARAVGISAPYLSDVERGRRSISTGNLEMLMGVILPIRSIKSEEEP